MVEINFYWLMGGIISLLFMTILLLIMGAIKKNFGINLINNIVFLIFISPIILISAPLFGILVFLGVFVSYIFNTKASYEGYSSSHMEK
jgi:hypothetical protein